MAEHVCEWRARLKGWLVDGFYCAHPDCYRRLIWNDVEARLNATERLSVKNVKRAEMAMAITFKYLDKASKPIVEDEVLPALRAYADAREDE